MFFVGINVVFYYIFSDKLVAAIVTAAMVGIGMAPVSYLGYAIVASPVFRALLLNPAALKKMAKEFDGMSTANIFITILISTLAINFVFVPELKVGSFYGNVTRPIIWACILLLPPMTLWVNLGQFF